MNIIRHRINDKGFTLLEMIIVLFLMTLILGISTIFFANILPSSRFDATVRNISATIRQARSLARIHNESQVVTIDLDSKTYDLTGHSSKEIPSDISVKIIDPIYGELNEGKYHFILHPTGGVEGGTIIVWTDKKKASIQIDPIVGTLIIK